MTESTAREILQTVGDYQRLGRSVAGDALVLGYARDVLRWARCRCWSGDLIDAEDLSLRVFEAAIRRLDGGNDPADRPLWVALHYECRAQYRAVVREAAKRRELEVPWEAALDEVLAQEDWQSDLKQSELLERLEERRRTVESCRAAVLTEAQSQAISWHYDFGHTLEQIAQQLGCTEQAVQQKIQRAIRNLRQCVKAEGWHVPMCR